ncbi:MAG: hypothetical protein RLZZ303_2938 [Candidatus Hydrogenedentota bacterium]|jgi:hypothetical protein
MRSRDIKPLGGPLAALLWEQWRMARPSLLLPLAMGLADLGLHAWCRLALGMRDDEFTDLAGWYAGGLVVLLSLVLLCHPDRRLEVRLSPGPRLLRLPVPRRALTLSALPLRALLGGAAVYTALSIHVWFFPPDQLAGLPSLGTAGFLCAFMLLYGAVSVAGVWGERAAALALFAVLAAVMFVAGRIAEWHGGLLWMLTPPALLLGLGGVALSHLLRRQARGRMALGMARSRGRYARVRELPAFNTPLEAQRWYETRRFGGALPTATAIVALGLFGVQVANYLEHDHLSHLFATNFLDAIRFLPAIAVGLALILAALDHLLYRRPEGRFLVTRPVHPALIARARMGMQARSVAKALLAPVLVAALLWPLLLLLRPAYGVDMQLEAIYPYYNIWHVLLDAHNEILIVLVIPLVAWCAGLLFNRVTALVLAGGGLAIFILSQFHLMEFDTLSFHAARITVAMILLANLLLGLRAGLLRPGALLPLLCLIPLTTLASLADMYMRQEELWALAGLAALPVIAIAGAPLEFHLRRSGTHWPRLLDAGLAFRREWARALRRLGLAAAAALLLLSWHHAALARAAHVGLSGAESALSRAPWNERTANMAVLLHAVAAGGGLREAIEAMPEQDRSGFSRSFDQPEWWWPRRQLRATEAMLNEAANRILHAAEDPNNLPPGLTLEDEEGLDCLHTAVTGLLSQAQALAQNADPEAAMRPIEAALHVAEACAAKPYPARPDGALGIVILHELNDVLSQAWFTPEQLARIEAHLPGLPNLAPVAAWLAQDLADARAYPNLDSFAWPLSPAWCFWYRTLGIQRWDQLAAAGLVQRQAWALQQQRVDWYTHRPAPFLAPLTALRWPAPHVESAAYWSHQWGYPHAMSSLRWHILQRGMLALRRHAALHGGTLPEDKTRFLELLPEDLRGHAQRQMGYRRDNDHEAQLRINNEMSFTIKIAPP